MDKGHDNAVNQDLQDLQQRVEFLEGRENDLAARIARLEEGWLLEALESRLDEKKPSGSKLDAKASCGSVLYPADEPCADDESCANQRVWCDGWGFPLPIPWKDRFPLSYLYDDAPAQRPPRPPPPPPPRRWRLRPCCLRALRSRRARWLRDHGGGRGVGIGRGPYVDAWTEEDEAAVAAAAEARARERAAAASRPDIPWYLQNARMRFLRRGLPRRPPR